VQEGFIKNNNIKVSRGFRIGKINLPFIGNPTRFLLFVLFLIFKEKVVDTENIFMILLKI
jgi:hypothetical protein